jgi:hypothetical protein
MDFCEMSYLTFLLNFAHKFLFLLQPNESKRQFTFFEPRIVMYSTDVIRTNKTRTSAIHVLIQV